MCADSITAQTPAEVFGLRVVTEEYERFRSTRAARDAPGDDDGGELPPIDLESEDLHMYLSGLYSSAGSEMDTPIEYCRLPAVLLHKYNNLSDDERKVYESNVVDAINAKEAERRRLKQATKRETSEDFAKGFGGTEADSKNEREAAALLRGDVGVDMDAEMSPYLSPPDIPGIQQHLWLKQFGRWKKYNGADCIMYINVLSRDIGNRPADYEDEVEAAGFEAEEAAVHPSRGLPFCSLPELPATIDRLLLEGGGKTILILDDSVEQHAASYFNYKAMMEVCS